MPFTRDWPKCLMPIQGIPLLEHWLSALKKYNEVNEIFVNTHYLHHEVEKFLNRELFNGWVKSIYEVNKSGTAGVIRNNKQIFYNQPLFVAHADNWFDFDLFQFFKTRESTRSCNCEITMLTFNCKNPEEVGVVELDEYGRVIHFREKEKQLLLDTCQANAAVYIFEKEAVNWICDSSHVSDISNQVIPQFLGRIMTSHTNSFFRDIGSLEMLECAQYDPKHELLWNSQANWRRPSKFNYKVNILRKSKIN